MLRLSAAVLAGLVLSACSMATPAATRPTITIGAIYPLTGPQAQGGREELAGVRAALDLAVRKGVPGADRISLRVIDVQTPDQATAAVDRLALAGASAIIGSYGSSLSVAAAIRADAREVVFWETGAVADDVTDHRTWVFRTVATGSTLGRMAARFTAQVLMPANKLDPRDARVVILHTNDFYGRSVAAGEQAEAAAAGIGSVDTIPYDPRRLEPERLAQQVALARPDFLWDVSYLDDGIAVWRAVLAQGLRLRGAIGTSSAFCMPDFQKRLGDQATGVFAADKPDEVVGPQALTTNGRALLKEAVDRYSAQTGSSRLGIPGVAGFVGGWALFHDVLGRVRGAVNPGSIRLAAIAVDVPVGDAINGGGVRFSPPGSPDAGQNLRAAAVVGQWQPGARMPVVYPKAYATGAVLPAPFSASAAAP